MQPENKQQPPRQFPVTEMGIQEYEYQIVITGNMFSEHPDLARMILAKSINLTIDLLSTQPQINLNVRPKSGIVLTNTIPQQQHPIN